MSAPNLALRWRPGRFSDIAGQPHVTTILQRAVQQNRLASAYVLTGSRGTGKTSTARILAKAATCYDQCNGDPCGTCEHCLASESERVQEIDAASRRTTAEMRAFVNDAQESPATTPRFYLIDETHMLTSQAQDILRREIERAAPGLTFILCTTEPDSLDANLTARCQPHHFRRLRNLDVTKRLAEICQYEAIECDEAAMRLIAHAASGSMRDAVIMLDQLATATADHITRDAVSNAIGDHFRQTTLVMIRHLIDGDAERAVEALSRAADDGAEPNQIHRQGQICLQQALIAAWQLPAIADLPQTKRAALQDTDWRRVIQVQRIWNRNRPYAEERDTSRLERAIAAACQPGNDD